ncbi:uncharacterized protein ABDE67_002911 [Symphorus nematophorus]
MTTCTDKVECSSISFKLSIKNTVEPKPVQSVTVSTARGHTLLQALQDYHKTDSKFGFKTEEVLTSGPYVVEVMWNGQDWKNGPDKFWETLLYNGGNKEVKPISLCYKVCDGDNVFLRFTHF